jgi:NADH-quinone oxidoreductase subunit J
MMGWTLLILSAVTIASAVATMALRRLVHCALSLTLAFTGLAGLYLQLGAEFVGLAQILVYVGAVAVLIVFAILLTRNVEMAPPPTGSSFRPSGLAVAALAFGALVTAILSSSAIRGPVAEPPTVTVQQIGSRLMTDFVLPLEVIALLLTVALIGAVVIAMDEPKGANP